MDATIPAFRDTTEQDRLLAAPPFWKRHRMALLLAAASIAVIAFAAPPILRATGVRGSVSTSRLSIATVERGLFVRDFAADGRVVAANSPMLYAPAAGTVALRVKPGDVVSRDQLLAVIDSPDIEARLSVERASLDALRSELHRARLEADRRIAELRQLHEQAEVEFRTNEREYERSRKAFEFGAYSRMQMERAEDAMEKARFALQYAQRNLESAPEQSRLDLESREAMLRRQQVLVDDLALLLVGALLLGAALSAFVALWLSAPPLEMPATLAFAIALLPGVVLAAGVARVAATPVRRLLRALTGAVASYRDGDFSLSLAVDRKDELGQLMEAHNELGHALREQRHQLVQREMMLDSIAQNSPVALLLVDSHRRIVFSNIAARHLLYGGASLQGRDIDEVLSRNPAELRDAVAARQDMLFTVPTDEWTRCPACSIPSASGRGTCTTSSARIHALRACRRHSRSRWTGRSSWRSCATRWSSPRCSPCPPESGGSTGRNSSRR